MKLFIAEKPSLGKGIADVIGVLKRDRTHIVCKGDVVITWCFGHLYEQAAPEAYDEKYKSWRLTDLPIVPTEWKLLPKSDAKDQIKAIKALLKDCTSVVNAGDPDREGQLLVDELLEQLGNKKPVERLWLAALDTDSVKKALANLKSNREYHAIKSSAEARARGDWLFGMNLTRAYTISAKQANKIDPKSVLSVGRVQTPTLGMIVQRDRDIANFRSKDFYCVTASFQGFYAGWKPSEEVNTDEEGRVIDKSIADAVAAKAKGKNGTVSLYKATDKRTPAPSGYSLSKLQKEASARFGFGAKQVLDIAQSLYETHKVTSYPRTDCEYLPDSQHADAAQILSVLSQVNDYADIAKTGNPALKSPIFNDSKITAHHAIIPTRNAGNIGNLSADERKIFDLIAKNYIAQFYPEYRYKQVDVEIIVAGELFAVSGKTPMMQGWRAVFSEVEDHEENKPEVALPNNIPELKEGQDLLCENAVVATKKTTPPKHFTEGTLIQAMASVHKIVTDPEIKKRLREASGIGTEATRAGIIETLKKRGFVETKGKFLVSTDAGKRLIDTLPQAIVDPGLTGLFEQLLDDIAQNRKTVDDFLRQQSNFVQKYVEHAKNAFV